MLEGTHPSLSGNFLTRQNAIMKCASVSKSRGYKVFAIQDGGFCLAGPNAHKTYFKYGKINNCAYGKGGMVANDVYALKGMFTTLNYSCFKQM